MYTNNAIGFDPPYLNTKFSIAVHDLLRGNKNEI
jgi:hypothetical protein